MWIIVLSKHTIFVKIRVIVYTNLFLILFFRLERTASNDYVLGDTGIKVPKGCVIAIPVYAMHHEPDYFPDPATFDPSRSVLHLIHPALFGMKVRRTTVFDSIENIIKYALLFPKLCLHIFRGCLCYSENGASSLRICGCVCLDSGKLYSAPGSVSYLRCR